MTPSVLIFSKIFESFLQLQMLLDIILRVLVNHCVPSVCDKTICIIDCPCLG